jgi:hypothetical protein
VLLEDEWNVVPLCGHAPNADAWHQVYRLFILCRLAHQYTEKCKYTFWTSRRIQFQIFWNTVHCTFTRFIGQLLRAVMQQSYFVAGCGNGKYLSVNPSVFKIGADRCRTLTETAREKEHEVGQCWTARNHFLATYLHYVRLRYSGMRRVESWRLSNVSANIAVAIFTHSPWRWQLLAETFDNLNVRPGLSPKIEVSHWTPVAQTCLPNSLRVLILSPQAAPSRPNSVCFLIYQHMLCPYILYLSVQWQIRSHDTPRYVISCILPFVRL